MKQTGILDRVEACCKEGGVEVVVSDDVDANPKDVDIDRQTRVFLKNKCDFTVGLGGGSSMDSAKAVAFLAAQGGGTILDYLAGGPHATLEGTKPAFPIICVTTTAGTGSETTPWWVITNTKCHEKPGTGNDSTMARFAIVDPELMVSLPREVTRNTGIDVLFHAMEAFIANVATPFTDLFAREAIRLVVENLGKVLENGKDLEARGRMAWANTIAGIAIGEGKSSTVGIHALGHSIGGQTDAPHGLTMAAVGPAYMAKTWDADIARYAEVTRLLGYAKPGHVGSGACPQVSGGARRDTGEVRLPRAHARPGGQGDDDRGHDRFRLQDHERLPELQPEAAPGRMSCRCTRIPCREGRRGRPTWRESTSAPPAQRGWSSTCRATPSEPATASTPAPTPARAGSSRMPISWWSPRCRPWRRPCGRAASPPAQSPRSLCPRSAAAASSWTSGAPGAAHDLLAGQPDPRRGEGDRLADGRGGVLPAHRLPQQHDLAPVQDDVGPTERAGGLEEDPPGRADARLLRAGPRRDDYFVDWNDAGFFGFFDSTAGYWDTRSWTCSTSPLRSCLSRAIRNPVAGSLRCGFEADRSGGRHAGERRRRRPERGRGRRGNRAQGTGVGVHGDGGGGDGLPGRAVPRPGRHA